MERRAKQVIEEMKKAGLTLASCESFTAGLFCSVIASVPGASAILKGGIVAYDAAVKEKIVKVPSEILASYGVVSAQCAASMAQQTRLLLETDLCVSFTGNAGPDALEGKPAGLVYMALADAQGVRVWEYNWHCERNTLRKEAVMVMLEHIASRLHNSETVHN